MSLNLILWDKRTQFPLYQTPTVLTQRVLAADDSQRALLYKAWVIDTCGDPAHPLPDCECSEHLARLNQWLEQHRKEARRGSKSPAHRWIRKMLEAGEAPVVEVIDEGSGIEAAGHAERKWVAYWRQAAIQHDGPWLLNLNDGGEFLEDIEEFRRRLAYQPPNKRVEP